MAAYGFVEISGVTAAITVLDAMCKTAGVKLVTWERNWGGRLVTIIVQGEVSAVQEAIAQANEFRKPAASGILPNPHSEIVRLVNKSSKDVDW
jgi:microcompartment protein CcmL/EutN